MLRKYISDLPEWCKVPIRSLYNFYAGRRAVLLEALHRKPERQLVVCGFPRSGTSLLYNMLSVSLPGMQFADFEEEAIHSLQWPGNRASKFPLDLMSLSQIAARNPHKKRIDAIVLIRDPRDVVTSKHPMIPDRYYIGYNFSWWPTSPKFEAWEPSAPGLGDLVGSLRNAKSVNGISTTFVKYEDLVRDPDGVQQRLSVGLKLEFAVEFSDFSKYGDRLAYRYEGVREAKDSSLVREGKPVDSARIGKWTLEEHRERIRDQFTRYPELFEIVQELGYSDDDAWASNYGIEPATSA